LCFRAGVDPAAGELEGGDVGARSLALARGGGGEGGRPRTGPGQLDVRAAEGGVVISMHTPCIFHSQFSIQKDQFPCNPLYINRSEAKPAFNTKISMANLKV
jgi:hypothetical protein